jgi:hypothetical protein
MMDIHDDNIYINVCSKDSAIYFPGNKPANFRVKLAKPLNLSGCWKIGLCEIHLWNIDIKNAVVKKRRTIDDVDDDQDEATLPVEAINNVKDIPSICIDCSVCTGLIVNGIQTRTIRKVWGKKNIYKVFPIIYYLPLEKGFIDTIEFNIHTSTGELVNFDIPNGRVEMTLKLKRC